MNVYVCYHSNSFSFFLSFPFRMWSVRLESVFLSKVCMHTHTHIQPVRDRDRRRRGTLRVQYNIKHLFFHSRNAKFLSFFHWDWVSVWKVRKLAIDSLLNKVPIGLLKSVSLPLSMQCMWEKKESFWRDHPTCHNFSRRTAPATGGD